jgi:hypothetical protein
MRKDSTTAKITEFEKQRNEKIALDILSAITPSSSKHIF